MQDRQLQFLEFVVKIGHQLPVACLIDPQLFRQFRNTAAQKAALLQKQNAAYNQFCEDNGLKKQKDRISIAKWNRSEAAKARAAAKRYNEDKE